MDTTIKILEETYQKILRRKERTKVPIKYIVEDAINKTEGNSHGRKKDRDN